MRQVVQTSLFDLPPPKPFVGVKFNGSDYVPKFDDERLTGQLRKIWDVVKDGKWRTLAELEAATGAPPASISAQLRHLRKPRFGGHTVDKRPRGNRQNGLWEYRLTLAK